MRKRFIYQVIQNRFLNRLGHRFIGDYQDYLLRRSIRHAFNNSPYYHKLFQSKGIDPVHISRREDLAKLDFFTTSADLQEDPLSFLAVPKSDLVHLASTTGTTGKPKITFYSKDDWTRLVSFLEVSLALMNINQDDVAQIMFCAGTPSWMTGTLIQRALEERGAFVIPSGNALSPQSQIELIKAYGTTCLFSTPSYLHRVTVETSNEENLAELGVKMIYLGAEPTSNELRSYLEKTWNAAVRDGYGMMELGTVVAGECGQGEGMHLGLDILVEVVDPDSGKLLPDGQIGELVFTTLRRKATPLIRYRSGDIASLLPQENCPCDRIPTRRISRILGRSDDMVQIGTGENFYPDVLDQVMLDLPGVAGFQMVVTQNGYQDEITLAVECDSPPPDLSLKILESLYLNIPSIAYDVYESQTIAEPSVRIVDPGTLNSDNPIKIRKLLDHRKKL